MASDIQINNVIMEIQGNVSSVICYYGGFMFG
jgi:hypothetical protein